MGTYELMITGTDGSLHDYETVTVFVDNVVPVMTAITNVTISEDDALATITDVATDEEPNGVYSLIAPAGSPACSVNAIQLDFVSTTDGTVQYQPGAGFNGNCYIQVQFTDDNSATDAEEFMVTVTSVNDAPVLAALANFTVNEKAAITTINASENTTGNDTDIDGGIFIACE